MAVLDHFSLQVCEFIYIVTLLVTLYSTFYYSIYVYLACVCVLYGCLKIIRHKSTGRLDVTGQGVFITGCDTGRAVQIPLTARYYNRAVYR